MGVTGFLWFLTDPSIPQPGVAHQVSWRELLRIDARPSRQQEGLHPESSLSLVGR